jgi:H+/Cl- antiporter ClcA
VAVAYAKVMEWTTDRMADLVANQPWLFVVLSPLLMMAAWALVRFVAPTAGGSGIPQVLAAIEVASREGAAAKTAGVFGHLRLIFVKIASSVAALLAGGAIGREGPTIQIAAIMFDLYDGAFKRYAERWRNREALIIAGGGAGLAAAFNTPLGGVVFAIEELGRNHFKHFKGPLILAVVVSGYVTQALLGPYLFVGHPAIGVVTLKDTLQGLVAAAVIGIAGAFFGRALFAAMRRVNSWPLGKRLALAALVGVVVSLACLAVGPDAGGGGSILIRKLLFEGKSMTWALAAWRMAGVFIAYLSGCAGGIFAPSLAAGAALGAKVAEVIGSDNPHLIIVIGMIAYLTGATRSPFTSFILVFEMTDRQAAVMPMLAAALVANAAGRLVDEHSFYEKTCQGLLARDHVLATPTIASPM